ncbi:hypothetical protein [Klebsiella sp. BIGb0407]|uniref:hypothetical protein n=1 Tax=Klebsiella sp. BIGb0407 TaxID=2940603 RepID=UPI00216729D9|nr:hypothetical protein [Klebsiella sp. BIGb0407]MCS3429719.1 hypothetical protein [Klebsiella sp. BIGb0407]
MLLKVNQSTQRKEVSLRDLFGDNLTAAGKGVLERTAEKTAHDLAVIIFSSNAGLSSDVELSVQNR